MNASSAQQFTFSQVQGLFSEITTELIRRGWVIATMESCTSGLLASLLTDTEGASAAFRGGYVTYSNEAKVAAGVSAETIQHFGVYSHETARSMADAARRAFNAQVGVGVTGSFGNVDPNNADSVPGEVYFALSWENATESFYVALPALPLRGAYKAEMAGHVAEELLRQLAARA